MENDRAPVQATLGNIVTFLTGVVGLITYSAYGVKNSNLEGVIAAKNCFKYLADGGYMRVTVKMFDEQRIQVVVVEKPD